MPFLDWSSVAPFMPSLFVTSMRSQVTVRIEKKKLYQRNTFCHNTILRLIQER